MWFCTSSRLAGPPMLSSNTPYLWVEFGMGHLDGARICSRLGIAVAQVSIERHSDVANEVHPQRRNADGVVAELDQAVSLHGNQLAQLQRKIVREVDVVLGLDFRDADPEVAHQLEDNLPAQLVIRREQERLMPGLPRGALH